MFLRLSQYVQRQRSRPDRARLVKSAEPARHGFVREVMELVKIAVDERRIAELGYGVDAVSRPPRPVHRPPELVEGLVHVFQVFDEERVEGNGFAACEVRDRKSVV